MNVSDAFVRFHIGDALAVLREMPAASVDCVITSPPYHLQRAYLPSDHPDHALEMGQEPTPAAFLDGLLNMMDELWRVLADHGTFWINLADKHAGSGGAGGDYDQGGLRDGQNRYGRARYVNDDQDGGPMRDRALDEALGRIPPGSGKRWKTKPGWPLDQSVAWEPQLFGASLAYGRNLLNGNEHRQWITRPPVTWCKPSVSPGALTRRFRTATELIIYGGKQADHFFDLDAVRQPAKYGEVLEGRAEHAIKGIPGRSDQVANPSNGRGRINSNVMGAPPLNWWVVSHGAGYSDAHYAVFPPELLTRPIEAGCPRRVCTDCSRPVVRLVDIPALNEPDDRTRAKANGYTNGRDDPPERGWERSRKTVGWDCGCPSHGENTRPGIILDPCAGSGTTGAVAIGHGRSALLIDLDQRNADLARQRVGMFLEVIEAAQAAQSPSEATTP